MTSSPLNAPNQDILQKGELSVLYKPFSTRFISKGIGMRTMSWSLDFFDFLEEFAIYPVTTLPLQVIQTLIMWTTAVCLRQWVFTQSRTDLWSWRAQLPKRMRRRTQGTQVSPRSGTNVYSMTRTRRPSVNGDSVNSGAGGCVLETEINRKWSCY